MVFCFQKWSDLQWEKIVLNYGFCKNHFGKMQLWLVEHFFLHKKVPVQCSTCQSCIFLKWFLQTHNLEQFFLTEGQTIFGNKIPFLFCLLLIIAFFRSDFLQNPYFSDQDKRLKFHARFDTDWPWTWITFWKKHISVR